MQLPVSFRQEYRAGIEKTQSKGGITHHHKSQILLCCACKWQRGREVWNKEGGKLCGILQHPQCQNIRTTKKVQELGLQVTASAKTTNSSLRCTQGFSHFIPTFMPQSLKGERGELNISCHKISRELALTVRSPSESAVICCIGRPCCSMEGCSPCLDSPCLDGGFSPIRDGGFSPFLDGGGSSRPLEGGDRSPCLDPCLDGGTW